MFPFLASINWPQLVLKITLTGAVLFATFGSCALILVLIQKMSRMDFSRKHQVKLTNAGNVRSFYRLQVTAPEPHLQFSLKMGDIPLADVLVEPVQSLAPAMPEAPPEGEWQNENMTQVSQPSAVQKGQGGTKGNDARAAAKGASDAGKNAAEKTGALASLLGTVGSLLPGKAGAALKEQGEAARNVQTKTVQTMQMPETAQNKVEAIQKDSGRLGVNTQVKAPQKNESGKHPAAAQPEVAQPRNIPPSAPTPRQVATPMIKPEGCFVQTKDVMPGESLDLTLCISLAGRHSPEGSFLYTLKSQQFPLEKLDQEPPEVVSQGLVHLKPVAAWRYWMPTVLNMSIVSMEFLGAVYFMLLIWL